MCVYIYIYIYIYIHIYYIDIHTPRVGCKRVRRLSDGVGRNGVFTARPRIPYMLP